MQASVLALYPKSGASLALGAGHMGEEGAAPACDPPQWSKVGINLARLKIPSWVPTPLTEPSWRKVEFMAAAGSCNIPLRPKLLAALSEGCDNLRNATDAEYAIAMMHFSNARMLLLELDDETYERPLPREVGESIKARY
jgi:hypothetical protein